MSIPKITVLMPVYNGAKYLPESIASILEQSYSDFELLIIDDASTDKSGEVIATIDDTRIRFIRNESNLGLIGTLNKGLDLARGEYIARMDQDDVSLPERFEKQLAFLESHPDIGVLGTAVQIIDTDGNLVEPVLVFPGSSARIEWSMYFFCPIAHPTVLMRRAVAMLVGGYSVSALHAEDYDFWVRLSKVTRFFNLPEMLLKLRKHEANMTKVFYSENMTTAEKVAQALAAEHLKAPYSEWCNLYGDRAGPVNTPVLNARMISDLYFRMMKRRAPSAMDRTFIRRDAGRRIFSLLLKTPMSVTKKFKILWFILAVDPLAVFRYGFRKLFK